MVTVAYPHIDFTPEGVPVIGGTQTKVIEVALDRIAHHWDADEMHRQHPHLSLAQIYGALTYYYDHQAEMDREIEAQLRQVESIKTSCGESPMRIKLKAMGLLP
jgi:uncharacterized protein (DUF433 family)